MKARRQRLLLLLSLFCTALLVTALSPAPHTMLSASLHVRKLHQNHLLQYDLDVLYKSNGEFICHFTAPNDYYLLSDTKGDLKLYNPVTRELRITQQESNLTAGAFLHYILHHRTNDMELPEAGFSKTSEAYEWGLSISRWENNHKNRPKDAPQRVELAFDGAKLMHIGYYLEDGRLLKQGFYSKYAEFGNLDIPQQITEITYITEQDSIVEDIRFSKIAPDEEANAELRHFSLPDDVIVK